MWWSGLHILSYLFLATFFVLSAVNPDPTPGSASGMMQMVNAGLAAFTAVALCVGKYLDGKQARERRRWDAEDRRRRDAELAKLHQKLDINTEMTAEVGITMGQGNGLSDRINQKLSRFYELTPDAQANDQRRTRSTGTVSHDPRHRDGGPGDVLPQVPRPPDRPAGQ